MARPPFVYANKGTPVVLYDANGSPITLTQPVGGDTVNVAEGVVGVAAVVDRSPNYRPGVVEPATLDVLGRTRVAGDPGSDWSDRSPWQSRSWGNEISVWG